MSGDLVLMFWCHRGALRLCNSTVGCQASSLILVNRRSTRPRTAPCCAHNGVLLQSGPGLAGDGHSISLGVRHSTMRRRISAEKQPVTTTGAVKYV